MRKQDRSSFRVTCWEPSRIRGHLHGVFLLGEAFMTWCRLGLGLGLGFGVELGLELGLELGEGEVLFLLYADLLCLQ